MKNVKLDIQRFSHTNSTTNYEFPQFVGTDKPAWLTDVNGFASAADTAIKAAKDRADSAYTLAGTAEGKADLAQGDATSALNSAGTANTNIGTMANLTTTDKTSLVGAVNEVNSKINGTNAKLNFTSFTTYGVSDLINTNGGTLLYSGLTLASNSDGSVIKLYGQLATSSPTQTGVIKITGSALRPTSEFVVKNSGFNIGYDNNGSTILEESEITFKTNGDIEIKIMGGSNWNRCDVMLTACIIFVKDFGDTPTP